LFTKDLFYAKALESEGIKPECYKLWTKKNLKLCLKKGDNKLGEALRINDLLYQTLPDNFLVKVDRAMMHYALEGRSPFLDYRLIEFAQKIPTEWKQNTFKTKILMREIISGIVPNSIVTRGKQGFTPPLEQWILQDKYSKQLSKGLTMLKRVSPELAKFYDEKVFKENNKVYTQYKIRLFLFWIWSNKWLNL
jgi:asparagine synthase (glutamine-hydrolysing)